MGDAQKMGAGADVGLRTEDEVLVEAKRIGLRTEDEVLVEAKRIGLRTEDEVLAEAKRIVCDLSADPMLRVMAAHVATMQPDAWDDIEDQWSAAIREAHPARSDSHDEYGVAMQMVGHRHSKSKLIALVNWLLVRIRDAETGGRR